MREARQSASGVRDTRCGEHHLVRRPRPSVVRAALFVLMGMVSAGAGCQGEAASGAAHEESSAPSAQAELWFVDVAEEAGIAWRCSYGTDETDYILETTGPGPAWLDYDNDGDLDLYLLNGSHFNADTLAKYRPRSALYRNNGDGTFTDVTNEARVGFVGWGGAALAFDFNNDGWKDLFVSVSYGGPNRLYRNNGDGTFADVTATAGVDDELYGTSACAIDFDRDGDLDIFLANYVPFDTATAEEPGSSRFSIVRGMPMSTAPEGYAGAPDYLYRNNGDGTFTNVAARAGLNAVLGRGLGTTTIDYNDDGLADIYVTNDAMQNFLYRNNGDGTFTDVALALGVAYGEGGLPGGSMGVNAGDLDGNGWQDIVVANYEDQTPCVYTNVSGRFFADQGVACGIGGPSLVPLQWGVVMADLNLDGALDVYIAGGHVSSRLEVRYPRSKFAQRNLLFMNDGKGRFREIGERAGPGMALVYCSKGVAAGDYDNDGDLDIAVLNKSGPLNLLRNDTPRGEPGSRNWLRLVLEGRKSNRDGVGARVRIVAGGTVQRRELRAGSSYASTEDIRPHFGLGRAAVADSVEIRWPSGQRDLLVNVTANQTIRLVEGGQHGPVEYP